MKAMILAAGLGTRLRPLTNKTPKPLIEIDGVPMLRNAILYLKKYGVDEIIINVHHLADQIINYVRENDYFGIRIEFSDETNELLDTGGGLKKAQWFFNDGAPFFLMASDIATDLNLNKLLAYHEKSNPLATLAVKHRETTRELMFNDQMVLSGWKNKSTKEKIIVRGAEKDLNSIAFSVVHVINPDIFSFIIEKKSFSLTSLYLRLAKDHLIKGYTHNNDTWIEFGRLEKIKNPKKLLGLKDVLNY